MGRRRELTAVKRLLSEHRLVTLAGTAGVGKSRLARRAAEQLVRAVPGGVWWVELERVTDPERVPHAVLDALGQEYVEDPVPRLVEFLSERPTVLVLDDCEHLVEACAALVGTLLRRVGALKVLVTSREVLRLPGEHVFAVEPLRSPDPHERAAAGTGGFGGYPAVALFCQRAAAAVPGFTLTPANERTIAAICRRLDGLPLAIELAATRLRALSPDQILSRLDDQLDLLVISARTVSARHRSLRGGLDWSWNLCTDAEREAWARLSVFSGSFELAAAEHVYGPEPAKLAALLDGLVAKSVLLRTESAGRVRFRLLGTVARYGRERLDDAAEAQLLARHADWYSGLVRRAGQSWFGPDELRWLAWLRVEHGNLRTALEFLLSRPDDRERALRMAGDLWYYWANAAPVGEAQRWLDRALAADPRPTPARAKALWVAGWVATLRYDIDRALRLLSEAEVLATSLADLTALAWTASRAALLATSMDDNTSAAALAEEALRRFAAAGETGAGLVLTRLVLTSVRLQSGDVAGAREIAEQCRAICAERGELTQQGNALLMLARASLAGGDHPSAARYTQAALRLRPGVPAPSTLTLGLELLGWVAAATGEYERTAVLFGGLDQVRQTLDATFTAHAPMYPQKHAEAAAAARTALGETAYTAAYRRGADLGTEELVTYALGEKPRRPAPSDDVQPALTARERQIAELVARGLSNRQIATKLVISQRTAETHIEHVLRKLNFTSRAQIAAWAAAQASAEVS